MSANNSDMNGEISKINISNLADPGLIFYIFDTRDLAQLLFIDQEILDQKAIHHLGKIAR